MDMQQERNIQTPGAKILAVDDEKTVGEFTRQVLEPAGYRVILTASGEEGLRKFFSESPNLVLLDVRMPGMDGWVLLQRIREVSEVPVIMFTAMGQEEDKVRGLRGGSDDYLVKPLGGRELLARIDAKLRRIPDKSEVLDMYRDRMLWIDFPRHQVHVRAKEVRLSVLEFRLLATLVQNRSIVMSADRLLDLCWGSRASSPETVRVYIGYLRKKLEENPAMPSLIETVRKFGYRYRPPE